jgi:hypothetical protein
MPTSKVAQQIAQIVQDVAAMPVDESKIAEEIDDILRPSKESNELLLAWAERVIGELRDDNTMGKKRRRMLAEHLDVCVRAVMRERMP